jgi:hypothetical protein
MTYTVSWSAKALAKLAHIWNEAADRQAVTEAADEIDAALRLSPFDVGESREASRRILFVGPLAIYYKGF